MFARSINVSVILWIQHLSLLLQIIKLGVLLKLCSEIVYCFGLPNTVQRVLATWEHFASDI